MAVLAVAICSRAHYTALYVPCNTFPDLGWKQSGRLILEHSRVKEIWHRQEWNTRVMSLVDSTTSKLPLHHN